MSVSRKKALVYAYRFLERPRARIEVELKQDSKGVVFKHKGRVFTRTYLNRSGMAAAIAIAEALNVPFPPEGQSSYTTVSSGVIYRILAISELNFINPVSFEIAANLIEEARSMQDRSSIGTY